MREFANRLVAHRGYSAKYPENSLSSIQTAIDAGAKHIEFDIQMNADHDLIVIHDDNFLRTAGVSKSVLDTRTSELKAISIHEAERLGDQFYPEAVPLLSDALDICRYYKDIQLYVEIKEESLDYWGVQEVMSRVLKALENYPKPPCVISFDENAIAYTQQHSKLPCGWVLHYYNKETLKHAIDLAPDYLICNQKKIPKDKMITAGKWQWMLYDITETQQLKDFSKLGVELFETDYIGEFMDELDY